MANRNKTPMIGRVFGELTVISEFPQRDNQNRIKYVCECSCGGEKTVLGSTLRAGITISCGCAKTRNTLKHGMEGTPVYTSWTAMKSRCLNPNDSSYHKYGGRGISVCDEWMVFVNFFRDMGDRPQGKTLDRINVNGNYEPSNCRWATNTEQSRNRRDSKFVYHDEMIIPLAAYAEIIGKSISATHSILKKTKTQIDGVYR